MYKTNQFIIDQLKLKLLIKNVDKLCINTNLNINLHKLSSLSDLQLIEGLLLLELYAGNKAFIYKYKKNYKEINIQIMNILQCNHLEYFYGLLKIFYLPITWRRNLNISINNIFYSSFNYTINNINQIPCVPDVFFK